MDANAEVCDPSESVCPEVVASDLPSPLKLEVSGTHIYWLNLGALDALQNPIGGSLMRMPLAGGAVETLEDGLESPKSFVVDGSDIFWSGGEISGLWKLPKDGSSGSANLVTSGVSAQLAQNGERIFWVTDEGAIQSINKDGSDLGPFLAPNVGLQAIAADDSYLYYTVEDGMSSEIFRVPVDNATEPELVTATEGDNQLCIQDSSLFWSTNADGQQVRVRTHTADGALNLAIEDGCNTKGLAIDGLDIYLAFEGDCQQSVKIIKAASHPEPSSVLIDGLPRNVTDIAVGPNYLFWLTLGERNAQDGALYRIER